MEDVKTNLVENVMTFKTADEANKVASILHDYLAGDPDYVSSAISLNIDDNKVILIIGDEASKCGKYTAMIGLAYAVYGLIKTEKCKENE